VSTLVREPCEADHDRARVLLCKVFVSAIGRPNVAVRPHAPVPSGLRIGEWLHTIGIPDAGWQPKDMVRQIAQRANCTGTETTPLTRADGRHGYGGFVITWRDAPALRCTL